MRHGGQVSLPGGAVDEGESTSQAALRELNEELGVDAEVELLGRLADCYVFASDFLITPWLAAVEFEPQWRPHVREVQGVVELPLSVLLDQQSLGTTTIERGPLVFRAPCSASGVCVRVGGNGGDSRRVGRCPALNSRLGQRALDDQTHDRTLETASPWCLISTA